MNKPVNRLEAMDIAVVLKLLPHRYPFLMVDRIIDIRGDEHGVGIKNVTINEPHFQGHFPGNPTSVFFLTIDKAKFRKPVRPGDTIEYHMDRITRRKSMWWYRGEAKVAGEVVAEAQVGAMLSDA